MKELAKLIKNRRIELGLTQAQIAKTLKLSSPQYISNIERGLCSPSVETVRALTIILKLSPHEVVEIMVNAYKSKLQAKLIKSKKANGM